MEKFKYELEKKERYYSEIEQENRRLKPYYEKFNQMKDIIEETMEKVLFILFVWFYTIFICKLMFKGVLFTNLIF
jgi:hypothetical protein